MAVARKPPEAIPGGLAGPGLLAQVIVSKYGDHLPLAPAGRNLRAARDENFPADDRRLGAGLRRSCSSPCTV